MKQPATAPESGTVVQRAGADGISQVPLNGALAFDRGRMLVENPMRSEAGKAAWEKQYQRESERRSSIAEAKARPKRAC